MPEVKTSRIDDVIPGQPWDGPHGTVYYSTLVMANGDEGQIGAKKEDAYHIGQELTYTSELTDRGTLKLKRFDPNQQSNRQRPASQQSANSNGGNGSQTRGASRGSTASFALSYAKDIAVANINKADKPLEMESLADKVIATAAKFNAWLKENE